MNENVFDLAQADTSLKKVSYKEYAGPCPRCGGSDRFHVQPGRKDGGAWFCRVCWPAELKGWGDGIEYLRQMRNMSFLAAKTYLSGEVDSLLEQVERKQAQTLLQNNEPLQDRYQAYIRAAISLLWKPAGKPCLEYLLARGLKEQSIYEFQLGCIESETLRREQLASVEDDTLFVVIPWYADGLLWRVQLRDIRPEVPFKERYRNFPHSGEGLYQGDCLRKKRPTFLVEDELSAMILAQEAGDIANVVATGGTGRGHTAKWEGRLARVPSVLVSFDRDQKGDKAAQYWLHILNGATIVKRWKPLVKDVNDMLMQGYNVRTWVQAALDYLNPPAETSEPEAQKGTDSCWDCGAESWVITDTNEAYCESCWLKRNPELQELEQELEHESLTQEQFLATVHQLAASLEESTGVNWHVRSLPEKFTMRDRVREVEQEQRDWQPRGKAS